LVAFVTSTRAFFSPSWRTCKTSKNGAEITLAIGAKAGKALPISGSTQPIKMMTPITDTKPMVSALMRAKSPGWSSAHFFKASLCEAVLLLKSVF